MKILIIGYGSIGKRHEEVLMQMFPEASITLVTKQTIDLKKTYRHLEDVKDLTLYDYFVIASETNKHFEQLNYLELKVEHKVIFCEKPLFDTYRTLDILKNRVSIGYVLRFHPLLKKLHHILKDEQVLSINVTCGQYLPAWRPNSDYRSSYSAKKNKGGGVLLDLSHEIDYVQWLVGKLTNIMSYQVKISNLDIDSDDMTTFIAKSEKGTIVTVSIDYISKIPQRKLFVNTNENSYELDFMKNSILQTNKIAEEQFFTIDNFERNELFLAMHSSIINNTKDGCTLREALETMKVISIIQDQNR